MAFGIPSKLGKSIMKEIYKSTKHLMFFGSGAEKGRIIL
jgi:hypothetical protein